jgi:ABC-type transport system involved in cytochrome c biogenesis permease component
MGSIVVLASGAAAVGFIILLILYFAPSVVAFSRSHHNKWAIFALNLLLGWTVLGWIGALVWSLTRPAPQPQTIHVHHDQAASATAVTPPGEPPLTP